MNVVNVDTKNLNCLIITVREQPLIYKLVDSFDVNSFNIVT